MWLPVEQLVIDGMPLLPGATLPAEWHDYRLMRDMAWSWHDLTAAGAVPPYVAFYCRQFLRADRMAAAEARKRA